MSDKHTAALDLDKLEALAKSVPEHIQLNGWYVAPPHFGHQHVYADNFKGMGRQHIATLPASKEYFGSMAEYIAAFNPATALRLIAKIRASEGQAQTSGVPFAHFVQPSGFGPFIECEPSQPGCFPAYRAAQLADSTAPGAPVRAESIDTPEFRALLNAYHCAEQSGLEDAYNAAVKYVDSQPATPTAQQSLTAGGAVPKPCGWLAGDSSDGGEFMYWKQEDAQRECDDHNTYERSRPDFDAGNLREPEPVFAAAPLPQVQSEALEGACTVCAGKGCDHCDGMGLEPRKVVGYGECRCILKQYCDGLCRPIFADQQPVTPSGALADNDGGVA